MNKYQVNNCNRITNYINQTQIVNLLMPKIIKENHLILLFKLQLMEEMLLMGSKIMSKKEYIDNH